MSATNEARKLNNLAPDPLKGFILLHYPAETFRGMVHVWAKQRKNSGRMYRYCYGAPLEVLEKLKHDKATDRKQDYYITANTMSAGDRGKDNIFALHNIVIDIDNHTPGADPVKVKHQYDTITAYYRFKEMDASGDYIPNSIVFTGRGVQLWYCIEQISYKRLDIYETITGEIIRQVKEMLEDHPDTLEGLELDEGASHNAAGLFRAPWSYNRKADTRAEFITLHDDYIESMEAAKEIREKLKEAGKVVNYYKTPVTKTDILALKRQNSLAHLVKLRQERGETIRRNDVLLCVSYIWGKLCVDDMEIIGHVKTVNRLFNNPMTNEEIQQTLQTALVKRYRAKNDTIINFLGITEEEQEIIKFYPGGREEERAKNRKKKAERNKQILSLYESGETQEDIARKLNIARGTVCNVLKANHARKKDTGRLFEREAYRNDKTDAKHEQSQIEAQEAATGAYCEAPETNNANLYKNSLYVSGNTAATPKGTRTNRPDYLRVITGGKGTGSDPLAPEPRGQDPARLEGPEASEDRGSPGG